LIEGLDARSTVTVRAVIAALSVNRGTDIQAALVAFAEQGRRNPELRREAVEALGTRCEPGAANDLQRIAETLTDPVLPPWEQAIGHTALAGLAAIAPDRAREFLSRSEANGEASMAVERAIRRGCTR
jgi:hypothetical protein